MTPSEMKLITMLFVAEGDGWGVGDEASLYGVPGWLVGWISCPNSSISTKRLLKNGVPRWSNDTTEQMTMGRGGKKYQT